jgi:hypothetical protein
MTRLMKRAAIGFVIVFAAAQLVRSEHANPATDPADTLGAQLGYDSGLVTIVDRACRDCHSNETVWPTSWYTQIAPVSWVIANGVAEGRGVLNFSEWATYSPAQQQMLLAASCQTAMDGTMPGSAWTLRQPEARLSAQDIATICAAARSGHRNEALP